MSEEITHKYFDECDILSCPKCCEAKKLANKYYNQMCNISDKMAEYAFTASAWSEECTRKLDGLSAKHDKIQREFVGVLRGRVKCCEPQWMLDEYVKAWEL